MRNYDLFINDILISIQKIDKYTKKYDFKKFKKDTLLQDAVIRNLEVIGEASKKIPKTVLQQYPDIEWKKIAGLRDILIHAYFGVDLEIIWDILQNNLPLLKKEIQKIKNKSL